MTIRVKPNQDPDPEGIEPETREIQSSEKLTSSRRKNAGSWHWTHRSEKMLKFWVLFIR